MTELKSACAMNVPVGSFRQANVFNEAWARPFQLACLYFSRQKPARCMLRDQAADSTPAEAHPDAGASQSVT